MPGDLTAYPDDFEAMLADFNTESDALMSQLEAGDIDASEWEGEMQSLQAKYAQAARIIGSGSDRPLSDSETEDVAGWLEEQYKYLKGFTAVISTAGDFNPAWKPRAQMYGSATVQQYWEGATEDLPLPAQPGQGTQCLGNCRCRWRIEWVDRAKGSADCYWELGSAEHCQTCEIRHRDWYPLEIRGGELMGGPPEPVNAPENPPSAPTTPAGEETTDASKKTAIDKRTFKGRFKDYDEAKAAVEAIEKIHKVPTSVKQARIYSHDKADLDGAEADFNSGSRHIRVGRGIDDPRGTLAHELGHWLDHDDLGSRQGWSSERSAKKYWKAYRFAVDRSKAIVDMKIAMKTRIARMHGVTDSLSAAHERWMNYALEGRETFARAYSQYVAIRSGDPVMLKALRDQQARERGRTLKTVWDDKDFEPIATAIDGILEGAGLTR